MLYGSSSAVHRILFLLLFFAEALVSSQTARAAQLTLNWADTSTNEDGFKIERKPGTTGTFAQIATVGANVVSYPDTGVTTGATYCYRVRAYNTAGDSAYSNEACGAVSADTQAPLIALSTPASGATVSGATVSVSALASDNVGVVGVQFLLDGANLGSEVTTTPYSISWNTTTATNGVHSLTAIARDAAGNQTTSAAVSVTVSNVSSSSPVNGLVAAYSFSEGNGATTADASGNNNTGALNGATWTTQGKFGNALSFNGATSRVTVANSASLQIPTTALTVSAWIWPNGASEAWSSIVQKVNTSNYLSYAIGQNAGNTRQLSGYLQVNGVTYTTPTTNALANQTWYYAVLSWQNGQPVNLTIYNTNGSVFDTRSTPQALSGSINYDSTPLYLGEDEAGDNWNGTIDEVRIYNRVLTQTEIQTDMTTPVGVTSSSPPQTYSLTVTKAGTGGGTVAGTSINCGATCSASYASGATVALTATPDAGSIFAGWSGDADCSDGSITMSADKTCTATFALQSFALTVTKAGMGGGTVTGTGINCGATCSASYASGATVALTATPDAGSIFAGWSGDADCSDGSITMSADKTCTATFNVTPPTTYTLTVTRAGTGSGTVTGTGINCGTDCSEIYTNGTTVTLTATPATGSKFAGWSGGCSNTGTCAVTISAATSVTATFSPQMNVKIGVFRPSTGKWYLDINGNGFPDDCTIGGCPSFGQSGNLPVAGDWLGTGIVQIGVFNPTTLQWQLDRNGNDVWEGCTTDLCFSSFSQKGDLPLIGHWDTKLKNDRIGIYRPSKKYWRLDLNNNGAFNTCPPDGCVDFGLLTGLPVVGDWNGGGTTKVGIFSAGQWKLDANGNGKLDKCTVDKCFSFGLSGDQPVAGDWDGAGQAKIGVFTPSTGLWELDLNGNGVFDGCGVDLCLGPFGQQGDLPVVGKW